MTGRRYARRASVERIVLAHAASLAGLAVRRRRRRRARPARRRCAGGSAMSPARVRRVRAADLHAAQCAPMRVSGTLMPAGYGRRNGSRGVSSSAERLLEERDGHFALAGLHGHADVPFSSARFRCSRAVARTRRPGRLAVVWRRPLLLGLRPPRSAAGGCSACGGPDRGCRARRRALASRSGRLHARQREHLQPLAVEAHFEVLRLGVGGHRSFRSRASLTRISYSPSLGKV